MIILIITTGNLYSEDTLINKDLGDKIIDGDILTPAEQKEIDSALADIDQMIKDEEQARGEWYARQQKNKN